MPREELLPDVFLNSGITTAIRAGRGIWHAPCPVCGGTDRAFVLMNSRVTKGPYAQCRYRGVSCSYAWWHGKGEKRNEAITDEMRAHYAAERAKQQAEDEAAEATAMERFRSSRKWVDCWKNPDRTYWQGLKIDPQWQDFWRLGFDPQKRYQYCGTTHQSSANTIPKFGLDRMPVNMDWRLNDPVDAMVNRYRPVANLPAATWYSRPDLTEFDELWVFEGAKKAMVSFLFYATHSGNRDVQFAGIPSQNSWAGIDDVAENCGRVWVVPDPDAIVSGWADALALAIGDHARLIEMPEKPDDLILDYGMTYAEWKSMFELARTGRR